MKTHSVILFLLLGVVYPGNGKSPDERLAESDFYIRQLSEQLGGDAVDYMETTPGGRLIMETRIRLAMFNYWVCISKFGYDRNKLIEARYGDFVRGIKRNGAFERTFAEPYFASELTFFKYVFEPQKGKRFEIDSLEAFKKENIEFLKFVEECAVERVWKKPDPIPKAE